MKSIFQREELSTAATHFERACKVSRLHSSQAQRALANYGDHGALISGCVRDHFPETVKNELRTLAQLVTVESDAGYAARPPRIRFTTMRHLARSIATRDGSGFYGPQPYRSAQS
jgi:hypothetical protein